MFKKNKIDNDGINEIIYLSKNILRLLFIVLIIGIVLCSIIICQKLGIFILIGNVLGVLSPLFIGFVVAWLFSPLVNKMTKKGMSRILASVIIYLVLILFLFIFFKIFIPVLYEQFNELVKTLPNVLNKVTDFISNFLDRFEFEGIDIESIKDNALRIINDIGNTVSGNLPTTIMNGLTSLISGIGTILFSLIIGLYMLFDFDNISIHFLKLIPKRHQMEIAGLLEKIGIEVRKCVNGTLLVACMVFVCDTIGFSLVGLNGALLFGLFCGITDLIPFIGPYIGAAAATIVALTQSTFVGIAVIVIALIVQCLENYVLQPIVMSKATSLHPVTIICGLLVFGYFFGIVGMILATPIMSIIKVVWRFLDDKYDFFNDNKIETVNAEEKA